MSFNDIIKGSLLKPGLFGPVAPMDIVIGLFVTLALSLFIFYIYKKTYSGVIYNHNYNVSLVMMALISAMIIMTISSNLVLSLGMVGALSIVRFRTAVKDPMDAVFIFWSIALGITAGARLYLIAALGSIFIGAVAVILLRYKNSNNIFMLIINYEEYAKDKLLRRLSELDYKIKSKSSSAENIEFTVEIKIIGSDTSFVERMSEIEGVRNVSLISYNGNFIG